MTRYQIFKGKKGKLCGTRPATLLFAQWLKHHDSFLEVGTFHGIMISVLAEKFPNKRFVVVDAFKSGYRTGGGNIELFTLNTAGLNNVVLHVGLSSDVLLNLNEKFGIIFIDGDHSYDSVLEDATNAYSLLAPGGKLCFHDYGGGLESVTGAVDKFCEVNSLELHKSKEGQFVYIN